MPSKAVSFEEAERSKESERAALSCATERTATLSWRLNQDATPIRQRETAIALSQSGNRKQREAAYIHDDELNEKYTAVTPRRARDWWTEKHASVPPIETLETHIIGGAIIPLWQRFKTHEEARLRVVRVTTEDGSELLAFEYHLIRLAQLLRSLGANARSARAGRNLLRGPGRRRRSHARFRSQALQRIDSPRASH